MAVLQAKFVKCPFYRTNDTNKIVCEGLAEGSTIHLSYQSQTDRAKYMKDVCYDVLGCRDCPIYIMLMQTKYEEGGYV